MQKLFYLYLSVSLSASVIIAVLFLCRPLWKRRFSKSWQYYIWLLAVVRLLIPLSPSPGMIGRAADWGTERLAAGLSAVMASEDRSALHQCVLFCLVIFPWLSFIAEPQVFLDWPHTKRHLPASSVHRRQ